MKQLFIPFFACLAIVCSGQDKYNYTQFNTVTEVQGTDYVITSANDWGKMGVLNAMYFLFINTRTGESREQNFTGAGMVGKPEQIRIDSLGINLLLLPAQTVDLDGKKGIDWNDPRQLIVLSTDGTQRTQLTGSKLFVSSWAVNRQTGTMVVTGHYDTNNNGKYDKTDKNEIGVYDLKTLKLVKNI